MDHFFGLPNLYCYGVCLLLTPLLVRVLFRARNKPGPRLPPGPRQLPVIGSLHHLLLRRGLPHHSMRDLSLRHGPLMLLRICERAAVVVSSAEAAREVFKGHDAAFSQRPSSPGIDELSRHGQGVIFAPYGDHWRLLRRILMTELLSPRRVEAFRHIREDEVARLVASLAASCSPPGQAPIDVDELLKGFIADSSVRAILGDRLRNRAAFLRMLEAGQDPSALFDLRDLFPSSRLLRMLPRGSKAERHRQEMFRLMDDVLLNYRERTATADQDRAGDQADTMADVLLRIQNEGDMRVSLNYGVIRAVLIVSALINKPHYTSKFTFIFFIQLSIVVYKKIISSYLHLCNSVVVLCWSGCGWCSSRHILYYSPMGHGRASCEPKGDAEGAVRGSKCHGRATESEGGSSKRPALPQSSHQGDLTIAPSCSVGAKGMLG